MPLYCRTSQGLIVEMEIGSSIPPPDSKEMTTSETPTKITETECEFTYPSPFFK
ncbi:9858_t:CDS:2 [Funneliformis caledonium]|uniref:9858_t:CDS:1 n=1 Tax=Funneliformis caledonium TaxID=1117310 RepID=A0A9N9FQK4_9GLOM|nr:9858_t:CDS:2 [Funneliformis caledonium]